MTTQDKLSKLEKITNYVELIKTAEWCITTHKEDIKRFDDFMNMAKYYEERVRVNNRIISRLNNRVDTLIKQLIK